MSRNMTMFKRFAGIRVFYQYLYMSKDNTITWHGNLTTFQARMDDELRIMAVNLQMPTCPPLDFTSSMTPENILAIIEQLKQTPPKKKITAYDSVWEQIKDEVATAKMLGEL